MAIPSTPGSRAPGTAGPRSPLQLRVYVPLLVALGLGGCEHDTRAALPDAFPLASLRFEPSALDFGEVSIGQPVERSVRLVNDGATDIAVSRFLVSGDGAFELDVPSFGDTLFAGETVALTVRVSADGRPRPAEGSVRVNDRRSDAAALLHLSANLGEENPCERPLAVGCSVAESETGPQGDLIAKPLDVVMCEASAPPACVVREWRWTLQTAPERSAAVPSPDDGSQTTITLDRAGEYSLLVTAVHARGSVSEASVRVTARRPDDLVIVLDWRPEYPGESNGEPPQMDLHFVHPNGCWGDPVWDCNEENPTPVWTPGGEREPGPMFGFAPELPYRRAVRLEHAEGGATYSVGAAFVDDRGNGPVLADVRIVGAGTVVYEETGVRMPREGFWWEVARVSWPDASVEPIGMTWLPAGNPTCR